MLYDDILLNIVRHCLDVTPQFWPTLGLVCRRWRQVILTSPLGLNLRLYFTYGTPVLRALNCWQVLPIIVQYGGFPNLDPPAPEDDDDIIAALMQSGRVGSISLTFTSSLLESISAISEPFSELEELKLSSHDNIQVTLPSTFRWGSRLRTLHSTRIAFPSFPPLLSQCIDLVDLQLYEIPSTGYLSPEAFANALAGMVHLRNLSLHFLTLPPRRNFLSFPPEERIVLPSLTCLKYRGTSKYLDSFVARIDAPHLLEINITLFSQPTMDTLQLGRFIERMEMQTSLDQADLNFSAHAISISFTNSNPSTLFQLQISCKQLDWQLHCMTQVCSQSFPFLFRVQILSIKTTQSSSEQSGVPVDGERWLELVRSFDGTRDLDVANQLITDILRALCRADGGHTTVLPALRHLRVKNPMNEPAWDALLIFINSRSVSGRSVQVNVPLSQCHICHAIVRQQKGERKGVDLHLVDMHRYRIMCSYCADFECTPEDNGQFREHLERDHRILTRDDALIPNRFLMPLQLDRLIDLHSSPRAPDSDIVALSTTRHGATGTT